MHGPGEYVPDVTEGVTRPEDLPPLRPMFRRRPVGLGRPQVPVHPPRRAPGRPPRRRGCLALPRRQLAPVARPPRLRPLRHPPELGGGGGGKNPGRGCTPPTSTTPWLTSAATWPPTRSTTGRSAC